jgi:lysophospholipase L1-like esterase
MPRSITAISFLIVVPAALAQVRYEPERAAKWEKAVAVVAKRQADAPPDKGGIVFAGSSTIRQWDLAKAFPDWMATNSGFGGSEIRDVTHFAERLILKHEPRAIVFYAGDNDINAGRSPGQVTDDFEAFTRLVHARLPKCRVYFIGIKPSLARWSQFDTQSKANAQVKELCARDERLAFIDIVPAMLGKDGKPIPELFVKDGLHLSAKGYEILNDAVRRALK